MYIMSQKAQNMLKIWRPEVQMRQNVEAWQSTYVSIWFWQKIFVNNVPFIGNQSAKFHLNLIKQTIVTVTSVRSP